MTTTEYSSELQALKEDFEKKIEKLKRKFSDSNQKYEVGDTIQDHYQIITVSKIRFGVPFGSKFPECNYFGKELTKKLKPKKSGDIGRMPQSSVLKTYLKI